jgi:hypothetical protein
MNTLNYPLFQAFDDDGLFLVGGKLYSYYPDTSTPKSLYKNPSLTIAHQNPVILDARGEELIYGLGNYKLVLKDVNGVEIWTTGNVDFSSAPCSEDDLRTLITTIGSDEQEIVIACWITLTTDLTVPENITLKMTRGGLFIFEDGAELTILGQFECGLWQCFDDSALTATTLKFQIIEAIYPEWFGAFNNYKNVSPFTGDSTVAIQAAFDVVHYSSATDYGDGTGFKATPIVFTGTYMISSQILVHGMQKMIGVRTPTFHSNPSILYTGLTGTAFKVVGHMVDGASVSLLVEGMGFAAYSMAPFFYFPKTYNGITQSQNSIYFRHNRISCLGSTGTFLYLEAGGDFEFSNNEVDSENGTVVLQFGSVIMARINDNMLYQCYGTFLTCYEQITGTMTGNVGMACIRAITQLTTSKESSFAFTGNSIAKYGNDYPYHEFNTSGKITFVSSGNNYTDGKSIFYFDNSWYDHVDITCTGNTIMGTTYLCDAHAVLSQIGGVNLKVGFNQSGLTSIVRATGDDHALIYSGYISPDFNDGYLTEYTSLDMIEYIKMSYTASRTTTYDEVFFYIGQFSGNQHLSGELTINFTVLTTGPPAGITGGMVKYAIYAESYTGSPPTLTADEIYNQLPISITSVTPLLTNVTGNIYVLHATITANGAYFPSSVKTKAIFSVPDQFDLYPLTIKSASTT